MSDDKKPKQAESTRATDDALSYEQVPLDSLRRPKQDGTNVQMPQLSFPTRITQPWGVKKTASVPGISLHTSTISPPSMTKTAVPPSLPGEEEARRNADMMADRISELPRPSRLPNLHQLLETVADPDSYVDNSPAFKIVEDSKQDVSSILPVQETPITITDSIDPPKPPEQSSGYPVETGYNSPIESLKPVSRPQPSIKPLEKPLGESFRESAGNALAGVASSAKSISGFFRKHAKAAVLAASLAATAATGLLIKDSADSVEHNPKSPTHQTLDTPAPKTPETVIVDRVENKTVEKTQENRKFARVLEDSKSPVVQDIINKGETRLAGNTVTDTMIASFRGLVTNKQILELNVLQQSVNLGISVYFNEHFGTAAKVAQSLKDPKLRNLYRTAQAEQRSGRLLPYLTKDRFPQEYQLAAKILADGSELGLDQSSSPSAHAQDLVRGNMFQAKAPGDTLKLRKQDGSYHVILEVVFGVFEGKNTKQLLGEKLALNASETPDNIQTGVIINRSGDNGSGEIETPAADPGMDNGKGQTGQKTLEDLSPRHVASTAPQTDETDAGWDEIIAGHDQSAAERDSLKKSHTLKFDLNCGYTSKEEKAAIIPQVAEKIAALYPSADKAKIQGLVRRYGYIGFSSVKQDSRKVEVTLNKNFHRILEEVLSA